MYPRLLIDVDKISHNAKVLRELCVVNDIEPMAVTKVHCAHPEISKAMVEAGFTILADSRIENLEALAPLGAKRVLLRLPMLSEVDAVVACADLSLNSEHATLKALSEAAGRAGVVHEVMLMVDLGDLREGVLPQDLDAFTAFALSLPNLSIVGLGVNLTCYGGVIPDDKNLGELVSLARSLESKYNFTFKWISGGNSSSLYKLLDQSMPAGINNLRLGEAIVLGRETAYGASIVDTSDDAFILEAQIIELKEKNSLPMGQIGMDAFGGTPEFVDRGRMKRAIIGIGRQDVRPEGLIPMVEGIEIIGASSDHLILDVTHVKEALAVGAVLKFKVDYGALLSLFTSRYVTKITV
jgi:predicted amino acid racemase